MKASSLATVAAGIQSLAQELPHAMGMAIKLKIKKKKVKQESANQWKILYKTHES